MDERIAKISPDDCYNGGVGDNSGGGSNKGDDDSDNGGNDGDGCNNGGKDGDDVVTRCSGLVKMVGVAIMFRDSYDVDNINSNKDH